MKLIKEYFSQLSIYNKILIIISIVLIIGIPFANVYDVYTNDVWEVKAKSDPHYNYRFCIILFGFSITFIAVFPLVLSFFKRRYGFSSIVLNILIFHFIFSLGVKNYPFWADGLAGMPYEGGMFDPKALLPMIVFGELWRDMVVYFYLSCILLIPLILIWQLILSKKNKNDSPYSETILLVISAIIISFFSTPGYIVWLAD